MDHLGFYFFEVLWWLAALIVLRLVVNNFLEIRLDYLHWLLHGLLHHAHFLGLHSIILRHVHGLGLVDVIALVVNRFQFLVALADINLVLSGVKLLDRHLVLLGRPSLLHIDVITWLMILNIRLLRC